MKRQSGFTLIELMLVVAIIGVLSVVAIPAFQRYMVNARTAEAMTFIDMLTKGLERYFATPQHDESGVRRPCQFPATITATPLAGKCCTDGEPDSKCEPTPGRWGTAEWRALLFKVSDKHYYSYGIWTEADGLTTAPFAVGDLDCDGIYSTFLQMLSGRAGAGGFENCQTTKLGGIWAFNETE